MAHLLYEEFEAVTLDSQTVESIFESQDLSSDLASAAGIGNENPSPFSADEDDVYLCGKCKKQFTSFPDFFTHKKEHTQGSLQHSRMVIPQDAATNGAPVQNSCDETSFQHLVQASASELDESIVFSETDILSFSVHEGSSNMPHSSQPVQSFPSIIESGGLLTSPPEELQIHGSCSEEQQNPEANFRVPELHVHPIIFSASELGNSSCNADPLPSIHSFIKSNKLHDIRSNQDEVVDTIKNVSIVNSSTSQSGKDCQVVLPDIDFGDENDVIRTEEILQYQEIATENTATVLLDYSNGQTIKACSSLFSNLEFGDIQNNEVEYIGCESNIENQNEEQSIIVEYAGEPDITIVEDEEAVFDFSQRIPRILPAHKTKTKRRLLPKPPNSVKVKAGYTNMKAIPENNDMEESRNDLQRSGTKTIFSNVEFSEIHNANVEYLHCEPDIEGNCEEQNIIVKYPGQYAQTDIKIVKKNNILRKDQGATILAAHKTKVKKKLAPKPQNNIASKLDSISVKTTFENENLNDDQLQSSRVKLRCEYCTKTFTKNFDLQQHVRVHTGEKPFQCLVCGRAFTQKSNVKKHMISHRVWPSDKTTLPRKTCHLTGKENSSTAPEEAPVAKENIERIHQTLAGSYGCQFCNTTFSTYSELKSHMKSHTDQKVYKCIQKHCLQMFPDLESFLEHIVSHSSGLQYRCHVCSKKFGSLEALGTHQYSHSSHQKSNCKSLMRAFLCYKCKRRFSTHAALEHHLDTSSHCFPCPYCGKTFTWERYLRRHLTTHGSEKSYVCATCEKSFKTEAYLKAHMLIHSELRPYVCQHCNATFNRRDKLARHALTHQAVKKYKCPFHSFLGCSREFHRQDKLKRHILTHSVLKAHRCKRCSKTFPRQQQLKDHEKLHHSRDVDLKCINCGILFKSKSNLSSHICGGQTQDTKLYEVGSGIETQMSRMTGRRKVKINTKRDDKDGDKFVNDNLGNSEMCKNDNVPTIEIIVMPVPLDRGDGCENISKNKELYVTFPTAPDDVPVSDTGSHYDSIVFAKNAHNEGCILDHYGKIPRTEETRSTCADQCIVDEIESSVQC